MGGGRQITKKECRSRTPFVSLQIFPCDLIAGKESWRGNDEERCPSRLLQIEEGGGGGGGESSHRCNDSAPDTWNDLDKRMKLQPNDL